MALALGENFYSTHGEAIEEMVARLLMENRATIAVAESCTGGLLAERLTNIAGSSAYFVGGVVCYSNELKTSLVGVPAEMIEAKGAVSSEVALALADGIRKRTGATMGVGVTGIAGPSGGTPEKPVGLVHIGVADERGPREKSLSLSRRPRAHSFFRDAERARFRARGYFCFPRTAGHEAMRLFVALDLPERCASALWRVDCNAQADCARARAGCARRRCT